MKSEVNLKLTSSQVCAFMENLGLNPGDEATVDRLRIIVQRFLEHVPFQNLTMLIGPRRRPTWKEICEEMLCGNGGLCTTRNPFLKVLLSQQGFETSFVSASMEKPDCHIGILVRLKDVDYWVDVGNGYPYVEPYPLGSQAVVSHPFFDYRVIEKDGVWRVEHRFSEGSWRANQSFVKKAVPYQFFDEMHEHHYQEIGWGPFLTGLRINRWSTRGGFILRDKVATSLGTPIAIESAEDLGRWIDKTFPGAPFGSESTIRNAWDAYCQNKQELKQ